MVSMDRNKSSINRKLVMTPSRVCSVLNMRSKSWMSEVRPPESEIMLKMVVYRSCIMVLGSLFSFIWLLCDSFWGDLLVSKSL